MSKKFLSVILAAAIVASVSACGASKDEGITTTTTTAPAVTDEADGGADEMPDDENSDTSVSEEAPVEDVPAEDGEAADGAAALTDAIFNSGIEFPAVMATEDEEMLELMGYDLSLFEDYSVYTHVISAHLVEIVVAKPVAGQEQAALDVLNARMEKLKTEVAFYPEQQETAEKTIVGEKNGYVYLLCCGEPAEVETVLLDAIGE